MSNVIEQIKVGSTTYKIVDPVTAQLICDNVESGTTASKTYTKGEYVRINDTLYKVTANIATGQAMTVGVNIAETNVGDELSQLNSDLNNKADISKLNWNIVANTRTIADDTTYLIADISELNEISITFIIETATNVFRKATMHLVVSDIIYGNGDQYILSMYEKSYGTAYSASVQFYFNDATHLYVQAITFEGWSSTVNYMKVRGR